MISYHATESSILIHIIEQITVGMMVYATDPETGETALKPVVQTFRNETNEWIHVTVEGEEIICTPSHPFYSPVKGWTSACDLRAGDILVMLNGEYVVVEQVQHELLETPVTTYNFEVEDFHTYYVGESNVLVHNKCFRGRLQDLTQMTDEAIDIMDAHHVFPQAFGDDFNAIGINHNKAKYGAWVEHTEHLGFSYEYNQDWAGFF